MPLIGPGTETGLVAPFTVFAPTNSAFAKIDNATLTSLLADTEALQTGETMGELNMLSHKIKLSMIKQSLLFIGNDFHKKTPLRQQQFCSSSS